MDCIFNKEKLQKVLSDFYSSTGIAVTLYDASQTVVATSPEYSGYCSYIRTKKECVKSCGLSNYLHMEEVSHSHKMNCYTCHAGLMEAILPIVYEDIIIAYLQIGQFRDAQKVYSAEDAPNVAADKYDFSKERLSELYEQLPIVSQSKLKALCDIIEILIKSFWVDGLISYNRSMLSVKLEWYVSEHLTEKMSIDEICGRFFISKNALYRLFRNEFGTTVNEYITRRRIALACELLVTRRELNVTEISSMCGFTDYNYFIRLFRKQMGITPFKYRK